MDSYRNGRRLRALWGQGIAYNVQREWFYFNKVGFGRWFFSWTRISLCLSINAHGALLLYAHGFHGSHGSFTRDFFWTRISRITRIYLARGSFFFYTHTDLTDHTDLFAYGSSWLWDSWISNEAQKMISVSHAKHWQIREICEIRVT